MIHLITEGKPNSKIAIWIRNVQQSMNQTFSFISGFATIHFVTTAKIQNLNQKYRHRKEPTNVLSFPMMETEELCERFPQLNAWLKQRGFNSEGKTRKGFSPSDTSPFQGASKRGMNPRFSADDHPAPRAQGINKLNVKKTNGLIRSGKRMPLGDIFLCPSVLRAEAQDEGRTEKEWTQRLIVHGCLHLLGFDHDQDERAKRMENLEDLIITKTK